MGQTRERGRWSRVFCTRRYSCVLCLAAIAFYARIAFAFRTGADSPDLAGAGRVTWQQNDVGFLLSREGLPPGVSAAEAEAALGAALASWAAPECSHIRPYFAGWVSELPLAADGQNTVAWVGDWTDRKLPASAPGDTDVQYVGINGDWRIAETDVYLNGQDFEWRVDGDDARTDTRTVLTHELGHALGLLHPCEPDGSDGAPVCGQGGSAEAEATMFPLYDPEQATLAADDIAGICYLYPSAVDPCGGCGRFETCVGTECHAVCGEAVCDLGEVCGVWGCVPEGGCTELHCIGQTCADDTACGPLARCASGVCKAGAAAWGDRCHESADCADGACVASVCQPPCHADNECGPSGACVAAVDRVARGCENSGAYVFGMTCAVGEDCTSGLCVFTESEATCTAACSMSKRCPDGSDCELVDGRLVCVPTAISVNGGCTVSGAEDSGSGLELIGMGIPLVVAIRRRRKRSGSET